MAKPPKPRRRPRRDALAVPASPVRAAPARLAGPRAAYGRGGYDGARRDRANLAGWSTGAGSANADLLPDLPTLRERARDLERNNALAAGALNTAVTHTTGGGPMLKARIDRRRLGLSDGAADDVERDCEEAFNEWAESICGDAAMTQPWGERLDTTFRAALSSGDALLLKRYIEPAGNRAGASFGLCYQLIEGDRLCNPSLAADKRQLAGGISRDANGAPVTYHILDRHPGDLDATGRTWIPVPAFSASGRRNVYHLFDQRRPEQSRGVPYLAPVIASLKQLGRYTDAEIAAAVVSSSIALSMKSDAPADLAPLPSEAAPAPARATDRPEIRLDDAGLVIPLGPDEQLQPFSPGRPNAGFDPFVQAVLRQIGVALEIPFELLVKHFTASYSAARAALLEAYKFFRRRRLWLTRTLCQPVYEDVLTEAVARGRVRMPGFLDVPQLRRAWAGADWIWPAQGQIDPLKEVKAAEARLALVISTRDQETAELTGGDWERVVAQRATEQRRLRAAGLVAPPPSAAGHNGGPALDDDAEDDTEDGAGDDATKPRRDAA